MPAAEKKTSKAEIKKIEAKFIYYRDRTKKAMDKW